MWVSTIMRKRWSGVFAFFLFRCFFCNPFFPFEVYYSKTWQLYGVSKSQVYICIHAYWHWNICSVFFKFYWVVGTLILKKYFKVLSTYSSSNPILHRKFYKYMDGFYWTVNTLNMWSKWNTVNSREYVIFFLVSLTTLGFLNEVNY